MNKKIGSCFLLVCQLLAGIGCTQTEVEEGRGMEGETVEVKFNLSVSPENAPRTRSLNFTTKGCIETDGLPVTAGTASTDAPATRAEGLTPVEEATLDHLCIVQFNSRGAQVGSPIFFSSLENATVVEGTTTLKVVIKKSPGTSTLYFLANAGDLSKTLSGKNEATFKEMVQAIVFTEAGMQRDGLCAMVGSWQGEATDESKSVVLTRAVAKINFSYSISLTNDFSFTPTRLRLCNVPQQIPYVSSGAQPAATVYTNYTAPDLGAASWCWYLPENQAGTAVGEGIATSEKEKTGVGVNNATYIELTGNAVQGTDRYPGVVFRLYPGSAEADGYNDYNVNRNTSYTLNITLTGIDFADKRVAIGENPAMSNPPDTLGAKKGATIPFRLTSQPSKTGTFMLPAWLSATIGENTFDAGTAVPYTESVDVTFNTTSINPSDDPRDFTFRVDSTDATVTQEGLVFLPARQKVVMPHNNTAYATVNVSDGVEWTLAYKSGWEGTTTETVGGTGTQELTFSGEENLGAARSAYFTVSTVDCDPMRTFDLEVRQDPKIPSGSTGGTYLQISPQNVAYTTWWTSAISVCANLSVDGFGSGRWHLPNDSELKFLWDARTILSGDYRLSSYMWTTGEVSTDPTKAYMFSSGSTSAQDKTKNFTIRCVRRIDSTGY